MMWYDYVTETLCRLFLLHNNYGWWRRLS